MDEILQAVIAHDAPTFALARPHVHLVAVLAEPREDVVRARPEGRVAPEDGVVDVEEDVHAKSRTLLLASSRPPHWTECAPLAGYR